jgi:hypothetical protein
MANQRVTVDPKFDLKRIVILSEIEGSLESDSRGVFAGNGVDAVIFPNVPSIKVAPQGSFAFAQDDR